MQISCPREIGKKQLQMSLYNLLAFVPHRIKPVADLGGGANEPPFGASKYNCDFGYY